MHSKIEHIAILGGGTAGWMCAAALSHLLPSKLKITLIESEQIGSVGVGEATMPHLRYFNQKLGIDEHEFMRATQATYKLGIHFQDWGYTGSQYMHPFGEYGAKINNQEFLHFWLRAKAQGYQHSLSEFCLASVASKKNRFNYPNPTPSIPQSNYSYAFQMDAIAYASLLRTYSEKNNVQRKEGIVVGIKKSEQNGYIECLKLDSGEEISADFFVDCSGFRSLLLGQELDSPFNSWAHWLPCNRAIAVPSEKLDQIFPYTKTKALSAGWKWTIPLQRRTGNGHVYCSEFMTDEVAEQLLDQNTQGKQLANKNKIRFEAGVRERQWHKNCAAIGLAAGFLEPLESTSIYLIQVAITKLIELLPFDSGFAEAETAFNEQMALEFDKIRDFIILHYKANSRSDSEFWAYCRNMEVPQSLQDQIESFESIAYIEQYEKGLYLLPSWVSILIGQGVIPKTFHPSASQVDYQGLIKYLESLRIDIDRRAEQISAHEDAIHQHTVAAPEQNPWPEASNELYGVFS